MSSNIQSQIALPQLHGKAIYDPTNDRFQIDSGRDGTLYAIKVGKKLGDLTLPKLFITAVGNAYGILSDTFKQDDISQDHDEVMAKLVECIAYNPHKDGNRSNVLLENLIRELVFDYYPVGRPNPMLAHQFRAIFSLLAVELYQHLKQAGAYQNNTLLYRYVKRTDPRHALFERRDYAVFHL